MKFFKIKLNIQIINFITNLAEIIEILFNYKFCVNFNLNKFY